MSRKGKPTSLPPMADVARMIREGVAHVDDLAQRHGVTRHTLAGRLRDAGYVPATGEPIPRETRGGLKRDSDTGPMHHIGARAGVALPVGTVTHATRERPVPVSPISGRPIRDEWERSKGPSGRFTQ